MFLKPQSYLKRIFCPILKIHHGTSKQLSSCTLVFNKNELLIKPSSSSLNKLPLKRSIHSSTVCYGLRSKGRAELMKNLNRNAVQLKKEGKWKVARRSEFIDWNYDAEVYALGKRLGEEFNEDLIKEALVDSSYVRHEEEMMQDVGFQQNFKLKSNQELSAAGYALLKHFLPQYLRATWPSMPEEGIQATTDYLISDEVLGKIGQGFGLKEIIMTTVYPPTNQIYGMCVASMVAALNVSSGLENTYKFVQDFVISSLVGRSLWDFWKVDDPYSMLANIYRRNQKGEIEPRLLGNLGINTIEAVYHVGIYCNKQFIEAGYGDSTDEAVKVAAYNCLSKLFDQSLKADPLVFKDASSISLKQDPNTSLLEWSSKHIDTLIN